MGGWTAVRYLVTVRGANGGITLAEGVCHPFWEHEFLIPDFNKFADLSPADPVGDLRQATGGKLTVALATARSTRSPISRRSSGRR